ETVEAGTVLPVEGAGVERRRLSRGVAEGDDDTFGSDAGDGGGEAVAAHRFEDHRQRVPIGRQSSHDHLGGPEPGQPCPPSRSAHAPPPTRPATRAPSRGPVPLAARRTTTPATSHPGSQPASADCRAVTSPRFSDAAATWMTAWSAPGSGSAMSTRSILPSLP